MNDIWFNISTPEELLTMIPHLSKEDLVHLYLTNYRLFDRCVSDGFWAQRCKEDFPKNDLIPTGKTTWGDLYRFLGQDSALRNEIRSQKVEVINDLDDISIK